MDPTRAFDDPVVRDAFAALTEACGGMERCATNYADGRVVQAMHALCASVKQGAIDPATAEKKVFETLDAYDDFLVALQPYQPSREALDEQSKGRARAIAATDDDFLRSFHESVPDPAAEAEAGKVFYFLPGSGGYWVMGRDLTARIREFVAGLGALRRGETPAPEVP